MEKDRGINKKKLKKPGVWRGLSLAFITLITEGGINFFRYLLSLGMPVETNLTLLSSRREYYYNAGELKSAGILINLRKLNLIKHLDMFLSSLVQILPSETSFIGYFSDNRTPPRNGSGDSLISRFVFRLNKIRRTSSKRSIDESEVTALLERNGFKIVNMTRLNGNTYFYSHFTGKQLE